MNGDSSSARRFDDGPTSLTRFDMIAEPPALPWRDDALVDKGAKAPKPCLSPVHMCTLTTAGGLLPVGTTATAMRTIFPRPLFTWSLGEESKKRTGRTNFNQLAPPCWRRVIQTESRQTLMFDPGGCTGRLRSCPFVGGWRTLLCGEVFVWDAEWYPRLERVWLTEDLNIIFPREGQAIRYAVRIVVDCNFSKSGRFRGAVKVERHDAMKTAGINE